MRQMKVSIPFILAIFCGVIGGLAISRGGYELFFPELWWWGRWWGAGSLAVVGGGLGGGIWKWRQSSGEWAALTPLLPWLLNVLYLVNPDIDLVAGGLLLAASLWLMAVLGVSGSGQEGGGRWWPSILAILALVPIYGLTMSRVVGEADTFEFQVVVPQLGIAHPTGYPLYLLMGKLFTELVPWGNVAWRLNMASATYGLLAIVGVYWLGRRLGANGVGALLAGIGLGVSSTFWSQAIVAEVYMLHALLVAINLGMMIHLSQADLSLAAQKRWWLGLCFGLGLSLTNHLTTLFLLPPAAWVGLQTLWRGGEHPWRERRFWGMGMGAFLLPLSLYIYLPWRWQVVNGEAMGWRRWLEWVTGARFGGALRLDGWLTDPTRYEIVGRLFLADWGWGWLVLAMLGFVLLWWWGWRLGVLLLVTWGGFVFYNLNYYVPDLNVFLLPAHLIVALWAGLGITGVLLAVERIVRAGGKELLTGVLILLCAGPILWGTIGEWERRDQSERDGLLPWGQAVLALPLAEGGAILADSEKIAPLYYWQQAEGVREDLAIQVLPDEGAYMAALAEGLAEGQAVYLARYLPGLAGQYHLWSEGPLVVVGDEPRGEMRGVALADWDYEGIGLLGYEVETASALAAGGTAVTLYWQIDEPKRSDWVEYVRWEGEQAVVRAGQHPVDNMYPLAAWREGEVVADFQTLPTTPGVAGREVALQVAWAPPFAAAETLRWQTVTTVMVPALSGEGLAPVRAQFGEVVVTGVGYERVTRPARPWG
ncbi:MAG TPA: DUF2723 domain-containing protein, partial [Anaerolineae bacterium]|nr:DUF2723 domain-containing protein [Anaerolineae bacterium]